MKSRDHAGFRVVLDTNVYLSTFLFPSGKVADIWRLAESNRYTVVVSPFIIHEFMKKLREKFRISEINREVIKRKVAQTSEIVQPKAVPRVIAEDPDDNHVLACAIEGNATLIVSGNKHLLCLKEYQSIPIIRPMDFLRIFEKES